MKKKTILIVLITAVLTFSVSMTVAYFTKKFTSDNNIVTAATFDVDVVNSNGQTIGNADFDLEEDLYPGMDPKEVYSFQINKNNTELPVAYSVKLNPSGALFPADGSSPIQLKLERNVDGDWVPVDFDTNFRPDYDSEKFRILVGWEHSENDIDFQGATGNIALEVVATQVDPEEEPEGPPYYTGEVIFKATPNGSTRTTTDKEVNFYVNDDGYKVIEIYMGEADGVFEEKVGDIRVVEDADGWLRVYTEHEYFASESQMWRVKASSVDTSVEGIVRLNKTLGPYLSIESNALYDWFIEN
ncbi:hypothetical protein [Ornithinibacillus halotolerans]|uniref:Uncharacterized protein n=1 Tax=Ornithinibacillus halotolerans TaxID=1274357 RepID=A0A916RRQ7_9BACI|nr:hypothetical protein [Ornithinibacillus halotolerans]GGA64580.1 hypothetical protein GCM10008025_05550 [Ornithinibacillus halotolerans]